MPGKPPYFPLYPKDLLGDDKVALMSTVAFGAYMRLLCIAWLQDDIGTLPNNDEALAQWAGLSSKAWRQVKDKVLAPFIAAPDGRLYQRRMIAEAAKLAARSDAARANVLKRHRGKHSTDVSPDGEPLPLYDGSTAVEPPYYQPSTRAFGSGSGIGSGSGFPPEGVGVQGAGVRGSPPLESAGLDEPPPGMAWPVFLAQEFAYVCTSPAGSHRDPVKLTPFFTTLAGRTPPQEIIAYIRDPDRDRNQPPWEFEKRWPAAGGKQSKRKPGDGAQSWLARRRAAQAAGGAT